jgi:hypothetical protein
VVSNFGDIGFHNNGCTGLNDDRLEAGTARRFNLGCQSLDSNSS